MLNHEVALLKHNVCLIYSISKCYSTISYVSIILYIMYVKCCRSDMIDRLCRVFGVDYAEDPDESYVLTSDNFLKMMAIHMRFRYN